MTNRRDSITALAIVVVTIVLVVLIFVVPLPAQTLTVTPTPQVSITITTKTPVEITVAGGSGNIRDYVALYVAGQITYFDWYYVASGTKIRATQGSATGTKKFLNLANGKYEVKLYALTDAGVVALRDTKPFTVELASFETTGPALTVTRRATNVPDQTVISVEGDKGTVNAPKDTKIIQK